MLKPSLSILFCLSIICGLLAGCASSKSGEEKVGMHFDAVLEFVVEYPLSWQKDRRLPYNSVNGEVRWTHPEHPGVLLKIQSTLNGGPASSEDQAFDRITVAYPRIELTHVAELSRPETTATLVEGRVRELEVRAYILNAGHRSYLISLERPSGAQADFQELMDSFVESFKAIPNTQ